MRVDHAQQRQHQQQSPKACDLSGELRLCVLRQHHLENRGGGESLEKTIHSTTRSGNTYMRLILQILNLCGILKAAGFGSKEHYGLEAGELGGIHQHSLVLAEDLVQRAHICSQLEEQRERSC